MIRRERSEFSDVYCHEFEGKQVFCYRTGLTVYEESFSEGRLTAAGWNAAGYTLNVLDGMPTNLNPAEFREPQSFDLEADGFSLGWDWRLGEREIRRENGNVRASVTLESAVRPVRVRVVTELDGTDVFTRYLEIENTSETEPIRLGRVAPMCGGVEVLEKWREEIVPPAPEKLWSLGYMDCSVWGHEGAFRWHDLPPAELAVAGRYQAGRYRHPMFLLRNNPRGTILTAQLGWAGGYRFGFRLNADGENAALSFEIALDGQKPHIILAPGERFTTPAVHIGFVAGGLDEAVNAMHAHLRRSVLTVPLVAGIRGWVVGGMGPERVMDLTAMRHFIDTIAAVGGETFILDAGWYCPLGEEIRSWNSRNGDWRPDPGRFPNGIAELREYVHQKGLRFGLWIEAERLGKNSRAYREHPEWLAVSYVGGEKQELLNLADPEAAAWVESELVRVFTETRIDLFRLDYNISEDMIHDRIDLGYGPENSFVRYYENVTAMYRRLKARFPDMIFENCAGGGGRTDVGFIRNFHHTWISDWNMAPRSFTVVNGMTMALPPEYADRLVGGMECHTRASLEFQARVTLFGRPTTNSYNAVGSEANPGQIEIIRHAFDLYKTCIRPWIEGSRVYHHTPEAAALPAGAWGAAEVPHGTGILERASGDGRHGVLGFFRLSEAAGETEVTAVPRGIDPALDYLVTFDNAGSTARIPGWQLARDGLRVRLPGSLSSELVIYEAV